MWPVVTVHGQFVLRCRRPYSTCFACIGQKGILTAPGRPAFSRWESDATVLPFAVRPCECAIDTAFSRTPRPWRPVLNKAMAPSAASQEALRINSGHRQVLPFRAPDGAENGPELCMNCAGKCTKLHVPDAPGALFSRNMWVVWHLPDAPGRAWSSGWAIMGIRTSQPEVQKSRRRPCNERGSCARATTHFADSRRATRPLC